MVGDPSAPGPSIRGYYSALRHRRMGEFGSEWASPFARLSRRQRGHFLRKRAVGPVLTMHLAAVTLQTVVRGFQLRMAVAKTAPASAQTRVPIPCRRAAIAAAARRSAGRGRQLVAAARPLARSTELSLVSRYLEAKMRHGGPPTFNDWILLRVQAWARMVPLRSFLKALRSRVLQTAARSLQQKWREYLASGKVKDNSGGLHKLVRCVLRVQRCWRSFTNRRIFAYLKETLLFREQGDPRELLRCINPREASQFDVAARIHVRFRLGGTLFPPAIYYKIYTHAPVTDVGAFAPRDYTAYEQPPPIVLHNHARRGDGRAEMLAAAMHHDGWYRRTENNGWRPVAGDVLGDIETTARSSRPVVWHHDKTIRREAMLLKRKQKKRAWLRQMYSLGKSAGADGAGPPSPPLGGPGADGDLDDGDLDALLQWSDSLDFDAYHADWLGVATSARPEYRPSMMASA